MAIQQKDCAIEENNMQTIDEMKAHCRDVGHGIEKAIADGADLHE